jgi:hypothetical protein
MWSKVLEDVVDDLNRVVEYGQQCCSGEPCLMMLHYVVPYVEFGVNQGWGKELIGIGATNGVQMLKFCTNNCFEGDEASLFTPCVCHMPTRFSIVKYGYRTQDGYAMLSSCRPQSNLRHVWHILFHKFFIEIRSRYYKQ